MKRSSTSLYSKCFFILVEKYKKGIHKLLKPLNPIYNGIGWYVEAKYEVQVRQLCQEANMRFIEFPLAEETFEDLRRRHKSSFFKEKEIQIRMKIDSMKNELGISCIDNIKLESADYLKALQASSQGKHLLDLLEEYKKIQEHIKIIEEEERLSKLSIGTSQALQYLLEPINETQITDELKNISPAIPTGYKINDIEIKIPGGALTILAAPTSHGKTTVSINFCLGVLAQEVNQNKCVYFFSYEESRAAIVSLFLNAYIGKELSYNNREFIMRALRGTEMQNISTGPLRMFQHMKEEFFTKFLQNNHLNVFYVDMNTRELVAAIQFLKKNTNVGLVCIDYMQLLRIGDSRFGSRQEELKEICLLLKDCAVETGLPIMLGAQFNRTVLAEADLWSTNIGEAGDIERIANTIIGFWNRGFAGSREGNRSKEGNLIPKERSIYFEILKSRQVGNGHSEVMDFDGNTGTLRNRSTQCPKRSLFG